MPPSAPSPPSPPSSASPSSTRARLVVDVGLVVAWAATVWLLGGGEFSAPETSRILGPLLDWLAPGLSPEARRCWLGAIRKLAHPTEYAVFAVLALRAVRTLRLAPGRPLAAHAFSFAAALLLAVADESRQGLLASRTGSAFDVGLDAAGALAGLGGAALLSTLVSRRRSARGAGPGRDGQAALAADSARGSERPGA